MSNNVPPYLKGSITGFHVFSTLQVLGSHVAPSGATVYYAYDKPMVYMADADYNCKYYTLPTSPATYDGTNISTYIGTWTTPEFRPKGWHVYNPPDYVFSTPMSPIIGTLTIPNNVTFPVYNSVDVNGKIIYWVRNPNPNTTKLYMTDNINSITVDGSSYTWVATNNIVSIIWKNPSMWALGPPDVKFTANALQLIYAGQQQYFRIGTEPNYRGLIVYNNKYTSEPRNKARSTGFSGLECNAPGYTITGPGLPPGTIINSSVETISTPLAGHEQYVGNVYKMTLSNPINIGTIINASNNSEILTYYYFVGSPSSSSICPPPPPPEDVVATPISPSSSPSAQSDTSNISDTSDNTAIYVAGGTIGIAAIGGIIYYFSQSANVAATASVPKLGGFNIGD